MLLYFASASNQVHHILHWKRPSRWVKSPHRSEAIIVQEIGVSKLVHPPVHKHIPHGPLLRRARYALAVAGLLLLAVACGRLDVIRWNAIRIPSLARGESAVEIRKLDNGLTVLIKENHANPIVTLDVWVNIGSMNEPPEINGVSHFLEHMMFKGTKNRPPGKVDLDIESVGGETNAATSKDFTHYYVTVASDYVTTGLDVLSDVIMNSTLDPKEVERERQVILEEYRRKQDSPFGFVYDEICEAAYRSGPYKQPVIGTTETLTSLTRAQLMDCYQRYYTPDNMVLVVVGDLKTDAIMKEVQRLFGSCRRKARPFENADRPTRWGGPAARSIDKDVNDTYLVMAFPAPSIATPRDTIVMDLILGILGQGRSSRLYQSLREKKQLVSGVSAGYGTPKKPGMFMIFATLEAKNLDKLRPAALDEVRRIRTSRVGRAELAKVKKMATNESYFANETTNGQADTLGLYYTLSGSEKYEQEYLKVMAGVTAGDILRVAGKYLDPDKLVLVTLRPKTTGEVRSGK